MDKLMDARFALKRDLCKYLKATVSTPKHTHHTSKRLGFLYFTIVIAISLSVSVYGCAYQHMPETMLLYQIYYSILYILTSIAIILVFIFIYRFKHLRYELSNVQKRPFYSLKAEPIHLYLRLGALLFGTMSVVYTSLRFSELWVDTQCDYTGYYVYAAFKIIFIILQTVFVFLCHRLLILSKKKEINFILLHICTVILCMWIDSVLLKITTGLNVSEHHEEVATVETHSLDTHDLKASSHGTGDPPAFVCQGMHGEYTQNATSYFLPALAEFAAITAAVFYEIIKRTGKTQLIELETEEHHVEEGSKLKKRRAIPGMAVASIISILSLAIIIYLDVSNDLTPLQKYTIHVSEETIYIIAGFFVCLVGFHRTKNLKFTVNFSKNNLDELLLTVTFFISVLCIWANILVGFFEITNATIYYDIFAARIFNSFVEVFQVSVQYFFIQDSFYRVCDSDKERVKKPGSNTLALLFGINFSLWLVKSFQLKQNDIIYVHLHAGPVPNLKFLFILATLPMAMLFRFHSTVCISILFTKMYENEILRFAAIMKEENNKEHLNKNPRGSVDSNQYLQKNQQLGIYGSYADLPKRPLVRSKSITVMETNINEERRPSSRKERRQAVTNPFKEKVVSDLERKLRFRRGTSENIELARMHVLKNAMAHRMHANENIAEEYEESTDSNSSVPSISAIIENKNIKNSLTKF